MAVNPLHVVLLSTHLPAAAVAAAVVHRVVHPVAPDGAVLLISMPTLVVDLNTNSTASPVPRNAKSNAVEAANQIQRN